MSRGSSRRSCQDVGSPVAAQRVRAQAQFTFKMASSGFADLEFFCQLFSVFLVEERATVVARRHTLPFLKAHGLPIKKWYGMSSCDL
jgi:hypothetical protein